MKPLVRGEENAALKKQVDDFTALGNKKHPAAEAAPGTYVHER